MPPFLLPQTLELSSVCHSMPLVGWNSDNCRRTGKMAYNRLNRTF